MKRIVTLEQVMNDKNFEKELYNDIKKNNRRYIYKVTPKYRSPKDTVPFGILMEAETIDNLEKKQMCRFCYNIQNGTKINYYDGSNSTIEKANNELHKEEKTKKINKRNEEKNKYRDYAINIRTKVFHLLNKRCNYIQKVEAKYIQETTAFENDIIEKGFKLCKTCTKYHRS